MMHDKLHIFYATDSRYLLPTRVAVASAIHFSSRPGDLTIHILDCGITDEAWKDFKDGLHKVFGNMFTCTRHVVEMSTYRSFDSWHTSKATYARLEICRLLPDLEWCVWADGDTLFLDDPFKLTDYFDSRYWICGHKDMDSPATVNWYRARGIAWHADTAICAGLMVMNLTALREIEFDRKSLEFLSKYPDAPCADQAPLNILCEGNKRFLSDEWGVFSRDAIWKNEARCIHYVAERPWEFSTFGLMGYFETSKIWYHFVTHIAKVNLEQFPLFNKRRYIVGRICGAVMPVLLSTVKVFPSLKRRYACALNRYKKMKVIG